MWNVIKHLLIHFITRKQSLLYWDNQIISRYCEIIVHKEEDKSMAVLQADVSELEPWSESSGKCTVNSCGFDTTGNSFHSTHSQFSVDIDQRSFNCFTEGPVVSLKETLTSLCSGRGGEAVWLWWRKTEQTVNLPCWCRNRSRRYPPGPQPGAAHQRRSRTRCRTPALRSRCRRPGWCSRSRCPFGGWHDRLPSRQPRHWPGQRDPTWTCCSSQSSWPVVGSARTSAQWSLSTMRRRESG